MLILVLTVELVQLSVLQELSLRANRYSYERNKEHCFRIFQEQCSFHVIKKLRFYLFTFHRLTYFAHCTCYTCPVRSSIIIIRGFYNEQGTEQLRRETKDDARLYNCVKELYEQGVPFSELKALTLDIRRTKRTVTYEADAGK